MPAKFSPSVNIIRDEDQSLEYLATPNAEKVATQISEDFEKGIHSFTLIGSYGTGKSSFLWAFEKSLAAKKPLLPVTLNFSKKPGFLKVVGAYQSITQHFAEVLGVKEHDPANRNILDALHQEYEKHGSLVLVIDELGKFLEYAVKNNPDQDLYFLQQLAELFNERDKNFLLLTTLHQNFEAYGNNLKEKDRQEWRKVKGRFHEVVFNEPVEQLLELAAQKLEGNKPPENFNGAFYSELAQHHHVRNFSSGFQKEVENSLYPLDVISATVLTLSLQKYGQNERSLFSFLELEAAKAQRMGVADVYDYLFRNFYSSLQNNTTPHYNNWRLIERGIERIEVELTDNFQSAKSIAKTVGLFQIFLPSAKIDQTFLENYLHEWFSPPDIEKALEQLETRKILLFTHYNKSYKLIEGTDLDFAQALHQAGEAVSEFKNFVPLLKEHFDFPVLQAKSVSYKTGTPRLFEFVLSEYPIENYSADPVYDGVVNLVFSQHTSFREISKISNKQVFPIVYGLFVNTARIKETLLDIQKTKKVLADNYEDEVAKRELNIILSSHEALLQHQVLDAIYSEAAVIWTYAGEKQVFKDSKQFNRFLSRICEEVYHKSPKFVNELANKQKVSAAIHSARKNYFKQLVEHWQEEDLGFEQDKFPPEKTIYTSLLKENGIHFQSKGGFELKAPNKDNGFHHLWKVSDKFLESTMSEKKGILQLADILQQAPYKIKQGLIDFWIPTFLFIRRSDFALYNEDKFVPFLNESVLYMMTRNPESYSIKAFELKGIRLKVFNKYRELLEQDEQPRLTNELFIESIRPFLIFYKNLDDYAKNTARLDISTLELRQAITQASDPEKTFFEDLPAALGMDLKQISEDEETLQEFFVKVNNSIEELKNAYSNLVNRIDTFIREEILATDLVFPTYKEDLQRRFKHIKEHRLLPKQAVFLQRLQSKLDDRDSWIASLAHAVLGKPLNRINDAEEEILKDRLAKMIQELQNLSSIHKSQKSDDEEIIKLDITTSEGLKENNIRIPNGKRKEIDSLVNELKSKLNDNKQIKLAILAQLLKDELNE